MSKHREEYRDGEHMVQAAHDLVEETETQHWKVTGKSHHAQEQTGKIQGAGGHRLRGILHVGNVGS